MLAVAENLPETSEFVPLISECVIDARGGNGGGVGEMKLYFCFNVNCPYLYSHLCVYILYNMF